MLRREQGISLLESVIGILAGFILVLALFLSEARVALIAATAQRKYNYWREFLAWSNEQIAGSHCTNLTYTTYKSVIECHKDPSTNNDSTLLLLPD